MINFIFGLIVVQIIVLMLGRLAWLRDQKRKINKPELFEFEPASDYEPGVYTLTFDFINYYETRDGVYRHYRIDEYPLGFYPPESGWLVVEREIIPIPGKPHCYGYKRL